MTPFAGRRGWIAPLLALVAACGSSDPVEAAGSYTVAVTNGENGCAFTNWTVGESAPAIPMTIMQNGGDVTADVGGGARVVLDLVLGSHVFAGTVDGNDLDMKIIGTNSFTQSNCTYTLTARARASVSGDFITGTIDYTTATNHSPDCGTLEDCHTLQSFNGTRPPSTN